MKRCILLITVIATLLFLFNTANATTWYVHPDSTLNSIVDKLVGWIIISMLYSTKE